MSRHHNQQCCAKAEYKNVRNSGKRKLKLGVRAAVVKALETGYASVLCLATHSCLVLTENEERKTKFHYDVEHIGQEKVFAAVHMKR